jgi:hypothetical protein
LLGEVPFEEPVMAGGDVGVALASAHPDAASVQAFANVAARVSAALATLRPQSVAGDAA